MRVIYSEQMAVEKHDFPTDKHQIATDSLSIHNMTYTSAKIQVMTS